MAASILKSQDWLNMEEIRRQRFLLLCDIHDITKRSMSEIQQEYGGTTITELETIKANAEAARNEANRAASARIAVEVKLRQIATASGLELDAVSEQYRDYNFIQLQAVLDSFHYSNDREQRRLRPIIKIPLRAEPIEPQPLLKPGERKMRLDD